MAQINKPGQVFYVLQDANYNLTGLTTSSGTLHQQYTYSPYGELLFAEDATGNAIDFTTDPTAIASPFGFQTAWLDAETGLICIRHRCYDPTTGRWISADPVEQGLVVVPALSYSAEATYVSGSAAPTLQYIDGLNRYQYVQSNPYTGRDPSGLFMEFDFFDESDEFELDWYGQRLYTLGAINEGARWASLGLETALEIGSGLLGIDVFQSVDVLASGKGGFWDAMNIVMAVAPIGRLAKVGDKIYGAAKYARKARGGLIAVDRARDLGKLARRVKRSSAKLKKAVREAEKRYPKKAGREEWHHIVPKYLGGPNDGPTVRVSAAYHQLITNAFRNKWAYGKKLKPTEAELRTFIKEIYEKYPLPD